MLLFTAGCVRSVVLSSSSSSSSGGGGAVSDAPIATSSVVCVLARVSPRSTPRQLVYLTRSVATGAFAKSFVSVSGADDGLPADPADGLDTVRNATRSRAEPHRKLFHDCVDDPTMGVAVVRRRRVRDDAGRLRDGHLHAQRLLRCAIARAPRHLRSVCIISPPRVAFICLLDVRVRALPSVRFAQRSTRTRSRSTG